MENETPTYKVTELTDAQKAAMEPHARAWIDRLDKGAPLDTSRLTELIHALYRVCGLPPPSEIKICASPLAMQEAVDVFKRERGAPESEIGIFEPFCSYGSFLQDSAWVAFYTFFEEHCGVNIEVDGWATFRDLIKSNVCESIQLADACFVCGMPVHVHRVEDGRLHSLDGPAILWPDGFGINMLWGVNVPDDLFAKIKDRTLTPQEALAIPNDEHRMVALRVLGAETVCAAVGGQLEHTSARGNSLYSSDNLGTGQREYFLRYKCPTTGREYFSFVPPEIGQEKDADLAMAHSFKLTKEQYCSIIRES